MAEVTMRRMLEAGVHFGHRTRFWSPKMAPYIFGSRNKIHIVNLEKTLPLYREALNFLGKVAADNGVILFVGTKRQASEVIREHATRCNSPYVNHRWLGGMLTNYKTIKNSITRLVELEELTDGEQANRRSKKENLQLEREKAKLDRSLSGIRDMKGLPDAMFVIDVDNERIAVSEAKKLGIPIVAVVDTNSSPDEIDYVIPGNDDAISAIRLYLEGIADMVLQSRNVVTEDIGGDADEYIEVESVGEEAGELGDHQPKNVTRGVVADVSKDDSDSSMQSDGSTAEGLPTVDLTGNSETDAKQNTKEVNIEKLETVATSTSDT